MPRKLGPKSNFRVVVYPRDMGDFREVRGLTGLLYGHTSADQARLSRDREERCEEIARAIRRHADNIESVRVECDTEMLCEHCGSKWTEDSVDYNGGCCAKDQDAEDSRVVI